MEIQYIPHTTVLPILGKGIKTFVMNYKGLCKKQSGHVMTINHLSMRFRTVFKLINKMLLIFDLVLTLSMIHL